MAFTSELKITGHIFKIKVPITGQNGKLAASALAYNASEVFVIDSN